MSDKLNEEPPTLWDDYANPLIHAKSLAEKQQLTRKLMVEFEKETDDEKRNMIQFVITSYGDTDTNTIVHTSNLTEVVVEKEHPTGEYMPQVSKNEPKEEIVPYDVHRKPEQPLNVDQDILDDKNKVLESPRNLDMKFTGQEEQKFESLYPPSTPKTIDSDTMPLIVPQTNSSILVSKPTAPFVEIPATQIHQDHSDSKKSTTSDDIDDKKVDYISDSKKSTTSDDIDDKKDDYISDSKKSTTSDDIDDKKDDYMTLSPENQILYHDLMDRYAKLTKFMAKNAEHQKQNKRGDITELYHMHGCALEMKEDAIAIGRDLRLVEVLRDIEKSIGGLTLQLRNRMEELASLFGRTVFI